MALVVSLLLVAMPGAPNSFLFLVVRPGAPSSFLLLIAMASNLIAKEEYICVLIVLDLLLLSCSLSQASVAQQMDGLPVGEQKLPTSSCSHCINIASVTLLNTLRSVMMYSARRLSSVKHCFLSTAETPFV